MKLHLPASLLSALLAAAPAVHAATSDIPAGHTTENVLTDEPTWELPRKYYGTKTAFVLNKDLTILAPRSKATEDYGYYANGDYIFTSADEDKKYGLTFDFLSGTGSNRLAKQSNLRFEDLKTLTLSYYNSSATPKLEDLRETGVQGAFYYDQNGKALTVNNVDNVTFRGIYVHTKGPNELRGGLISTYNENSKVEFTNNGTIRFANLTLSNTGSGSGTTSKPYVVGWVAGGVMHTGGDVSFAGNKAVSFTNITTSVARYAEKDSKESNAFGGAIAAYQGDVNFSGNANVTFSGGVVQSADARAFGGAISLFSSTNLGAGSTLSISENGNVTFKDNYADARDRSNLSSMSYGGAIAAGAGDIINIVNNTGTVKFDGNHAEHMGGAIYATRTGGDTTVGLSPAKINIAGNNEVYFTKNYVACGSRAYNYTADIYGGAIYAESLVTIANNKYVEFSGNYLHNNSGKRQGAAIYMAGSDASASLVIEGNQQVIFKKNYTLDSYNVSGAYCYFGSIYGENTKAKNVFSAKTGGNIQFHDAVYLMGDLAINSDYLDKSGVSQSAGGVVLFTGAYLAEYQDDPVISDYNFSGDPYTSTLGGDVTVHGGTLQVNGNAKVNIGGGLSVAGSVDNVANVKVGNGALNVGSLTSDAGSKNINLNAYGAMSLTGAAVVTAGQVTLDGATLDMSGTAKLTATAGDLTASNAAGITMTGGALSIGSKKLTLDTGAEMNLSGSAAVTAGQVTLTDATLKMQGGKLTATGGNLVVTKSNPEVVLADEGAAEKTYDVAISGGTLDIGTRTLGLGSGTSMELSGGQVKAGQVTLENAALDMAGDAVLTASDQVTLDGSTLTMDGGTLNASAQGLAVQAAGIKMTGGTLNNGEHVLALDAGTSMELSGNAAVTARQVTLTDATLTMQGGKLTATGGNLEVRKSSPEVALADEGAAEKTYDVSVTGGTLDIGDQALDLGSGTSMELSGGQVKAGQVTLENAALDMAGDAKLTASGQVELAGAKLTIAGEAQVDAQGGVTVKRTADCQAELVMKGGRLNAGTLVLQDATLQMEGGVVDASTGGVNLYDSASLVMKGGELKAGENDITLGAGMKLSLSESAVVSAGRITLGADASLLVSVPTTGGADTPAVQTLSSVDNMDPTVQGAMAGATLSSDLVLMGGSTYTAEGGSLSLDRHALTLSTSDDSKINLVLTLDQLANPDAQVIIFSEVNMVNFLFNVDGEAAFASADGIVSVSASNYFNNEWTNEYYVNFDQSAGLVYLSSGLPTGPSDPVTPPDTPPVPEPTTSTLSLVALAGLALRRRRRH